MKRDWKARERYIRENGEIPEDYEVHHKLPLRFGGTNDMENLIAVSKEEHKQLHLELYEKYGDFRDLCAYHMIGYNFTEAHRISASEGGKIGGKIVKERGIGIFRCEEERKKWASMAGKIGGKKQYEEKIGIHAQTKEERLKFASMGGKVGGFTNPDIQRELGKRGGVKNKGFVWINDGKNSYKYTKKMQHDLPLDQYLKENPKYFKGRILKGRKNED